MTRTNRVGTEHGDFGTALVGKPPSNLIPFEEWLASLGRSKVSGWRYRKKQMVTTVNLMGRVFVSRQEIARFEQRAMAGEFARARSTPSG